MCDAFGKSGHAGCGEPERGARRPHCPPPPLPQPPRCGRWQKSRCCEFAQCSPHSRLHHAICTLLLGEPAARKGGSMSQAASIQATASSCRAARLVPAGLLPLPAWHAPLQVKPACLVCHACISRLMRRSAPQLAALLACSPCPARGAPELQNGMLFAAGGVVGGDVCHPSLPPKQVAAQPAVVRRRNPATPIEPWHSLPRHGGRQGRGASRGCRNESPAVRFRSRPGRGLPTDGGTAGRPAACRP